jgi:hypothetical protein
MDSFKRGFAFLKQSWQMAAADRDLIKPSIMALFAGIVITLIGAIPIVLAGVVLGESRLGQVIMFILGAILVFVQYSVSYVFSSMTIYLIYGYLSEGDGRMDKAWAIVRRDFFDILSLAGASTAVNILKGSVKGKGSSGGRNVLAGLIDTIWTEATYLVLPAIVIEDINLKDGLKRATNIVKNNLLLVGVSTVGVKAVTGLIGFLLGATGIALGLGVGFGIISITQSSPFGLISGITLGVIIAGIFIMVATVIGSYTATAYHTCLYLWATQVEKAISSGQSDRSVIAPEPLAAVLGQAQQPAPLSAH